MEVLDPKTEIGLSISKIDSSGPKISFFKEIQENEEVTLQLFPTLFINLEERFFEVRIKAQFYNSSEDTVISSPIMIMIYFTAKNFESIFNITKKGIEIVQMPIIFNMIDTTIGTFRGVLYEQTKGTTLSNFSLPIIVLKDFIKELKVRVFKKEENKELSNK